MPGSVQAALQRLNHPLPKQPIHAPSKFIVLQYRAKLQTNDNDNARHSQRNRPNSSNRCIMPKLLTLFHILNTLESKQTKATQKNVALIQHFFNYCATHPDTEIKSTAGNMLLKVHMGASYLGETEAKSQFGGFHYLGNANDTKLNTLILALAEMLWHVVLSATKAKLAGMSQNAKRAIPIRITLVDTGVA